MIRHRLVAVAALALSVASGCDAADPEPAPPTPLAPQRVEPSPQDGLPASHPDLESLRVASRAPRRLSVDELERTWEAIGELPAGSVQIPENLARSLGEPDWMSVTEPNLEPSPLFMKFMVDLGSILCRNLIEADRFRRPADRVILRSDEVDANIRQLILRFWGVDAEVDDDPDVGRLRAVFDEASAATAEPLAGWMAVCLALSTAPEFVLY